MLKRCACGHNQRLNLRTVIHARKVSITNVPVYSCERCSRNEVYPGVKEDLGRLIGRLGAKPQPNVIRFDQLHELAGILREAVSRKEPFAAHTVARLAEERTNALLDLMLVASSVGDEVWTMELKERLSQLSAQYIS